MSVNKRYDMTSEHVEQFLAKPLPEQRPVQQWRPPWPPICISEYEWILMRDSDRNPAAVVRSLTMGPRNERFFRVVSWAPTSEGRKLVGYYNTLDEADRSVMFSPDTPKTPDVRESAGWAAAPPNSRG